MGTRILFHRVLRVLRALPSSDSAHTFPSSSSSSSAHFSAFRMSAQSCCFSTDVNLARGKACYVACSKHVEKKLQAHLASQHAQFACTAKSYGPSFRPSTRPICFHRNPARRAVRNVLLHNHH